MTAAQPDLFPEQAALTDARGEYARTPPWLIDAGLRLLPPAFRPAEVLDLGAGLGDLAAACVRFYGSTIQTVTAVEREHDRCEHLRATHPDWTICESDLHQWVRLVHRPWPLVVCNPPFSLALEWVAQALPLVAPDGALLVIYPLEHLGGLAHWQALYRSRPPAIVGVSPRRPRGQGWDDARAIVCACWRGTGCAWRGTELVWMEVEG